MQRQDIKTMIDRLDQLELKDEFDQCCIDSAIDFLEELGNLVNKLQLENTKLKQTVSQLEAMIDD